MHSKAMLSVLFNIIRNFFARTVPLVSGCGGPPRNLWPDSQRFSYFDDAALKVSRHFKAVDAFAKRSCEA